MLNLMRWYPWREMFSMAETMNRMMTRQVMRTMTGRPMWPDQTQPLALDVFETDETWQAEVLLPGVQPNEIDVSIQGNILTITVDETADRRHELMERSGYREQHYGAFQRSITLPGEVDSEAAEATFEQDVLKLVLPKIKGLPARRVAVKAGVE